MSNTTREQVIRAALLGVALALPGAVSIAAEASPQDIYPLPFNAVDLPPGHFATGGNHGAASEDDDKDTHARDWVLHRLDEGGAWTNKYADVTDNPHCANGEPGCAEYGRHIVYRVPLYAPADGEIVSCWRNHPNNTEENKKLRCCGGDCTLKNEKGKSLACDDDSGPITCPAQLGCPVTRSGNFIALLTAENHRILFAHLAPGSIPKEVCPFDQELMNNANVHACDSNKCPFPLEAIIPENQRPKVRRGDFIGRAGSSGASSHPHTHIHQGRMKVDSAGRLVNDGDSRPYLIENAWMRPSDAPAWTKLSAWEMKKTDANPEPRIHPSPFLRRSTGNADPAGAMVLAGSVVAFIDAQDKLQVSAWDIDDAGGIERQHSTTGAAVDLIAAAQPGSGRDVVTASRTKGGNFRIDSWSVSQDGSIRHKDHQTPGPIGDVAVTPFPTGTGVIVAVQAGNGKLSLMSYETDAAGDLRRRATVEGGDVRAVAVAEIRKGRRSGESPSEAFAGAATAVKTQSGKLRVQTWRWNADSKSLTAAHSHVGEDVLGQLAIAAVPLPDDRQMLVTAALTESGLLLQSWSVNSRGELENRWSKRLGDARHVTINAVSDGRFVTSLQDAQGELKITGWSLGPQGKIDRIGDEKAGAVGHVSSAMLRRNDGKTRLILTAVRDGQQNLRMIVYDSNL